MERHFRIRNATLGDLEILIEFSQNLAMETEQKQLDPQTVRAGVAALLQDPLGLILVAEDDHGEVVGELILGGREWSEWRNGQIWWLTSIYIRPDSRDQGIAKALYQEMRERAAQQKNPKVIGLRGCVFKSNMAGKHINARCGLHPSEEYVLVEEWLPD